MPWQVKTLKDAMRPVLWINSIFCMGVFEKPTNRPRYLLTFIYITLITIGYLMLFYKTVIIYIEIFTKERITFYCVVAVTVLVALCSVVLFWCKFKNVNIIIKRCAIVDNTLEKFGLEKDYKKVFYTVLRNLIFVILSMMILLAMQVSWTRKVFSSEYMMYMNITCGFPSMINAVVDLTLSSLVRHIKMKFRRINDLMKNVIHSTNEADICSQRQNKLITVMRNNYTSNKERMTHLLQTLRQLHLEITKIARLVNNTYCIQILLERAVHFVIIVSVCYSLYLILSDKTVYEITTIRIMTIIYWGLIYSFKIVYINNLCSKTSNEAHKIGAIMQTIDSSLLDDELREEIQQFTQQIILNPLKFTAAGFFTLNNACTGKFFSTVTAYVVILIQFRAS